MVDVVLIHFDAYQSLEFTHSLFLHDILSVSSLSLCTLSPFLTSFDLISPLRFSARV
jgi:hypothetical protein